MSAGWYVVYTHPHGEQTALRHLERQGLTGYLPCYAGERRHARRCEQVRKPLFPRYLFVSFDPEVTRWRAILSTTGVADLILRDGLPAALPQHLVDQLRGMEDESGMVRLPEPSPLVPGQPVRLQGGAFAEQTGLYQGMSDHDRVVVLLDVLGRRVRATVPREAVVPVV